MRIIVDYRNAGPEQVKEVVFDDRVQIKTWNMLLKDDMKLPADTLIMRKAKIDLDSEGKIPDATLNDIRKCGLASNY